ncbi:MAG TPA: copper uptake system-associated protein [Burkholderiaceae bacterium]|nr:copper uptake system-associated protein [Burkholderiaceae bacterium]
MLAIAGGLLASAASAHHQDGAPHGMTEAAPSIRAVIASTYDTLESKVETAPIVVRGDYAVADWIQGHRGGRALMQRRDGAWQIAACGGEAFRTVDGLKLAGVPADTAVQLVALLTRAEGSLANDRVKLFDSFDAKNGGAGHHHGAQR